MPPKMVMVMLCLLATTFSTSYGQSVDPNVVDANRLSDGTITSLDRKYSDLTTTIDKRSIDVLRRMEAEEVTVQKKLQGKDSLAGRQQLLSDAMSKYEALKAKLQSPVGTNTGQLREYLPGLDSLQSAIKFLSAGNLPPGKLQELQTLTSTLQQLQGRLQQAGQVQSLISQREQQLQTQFSQYGIGHQLLQLNKQAYYYQQQLAEYKAILSDKHRLEQTVLSMVSQLPAFKSFIQKNGMMAQLFPTPANFGTGASIAGLQTSAQVQNMIAQKVGKSSSNSGGPNTGEEQPTANLDPRQYIDQQTQTAQSGLDKLKNKLKQLGNAGGSTNMTMPAFSPNSQKTRTFLQRLEYGLNIQNTPSTYLLPVTSAVAGTIGYKISDKASAGVGVSYNLGWGTGINHIHFSSQGIGLRSYIDIKAKGSIWITGGFEYNYLQQFASLADLQHFDIWQKSALLGLTKKASLGKKTGNLQLLYDFLAADQVPQAAPFKFRIGYTF